MYISFFSGWHHRLNSKAGMSGLGFYRIVPLLRREAVLMDLALRAGDLRRDNRGAYRRLETLSAGALDEVPGPRDNNNPVPAGMRLTVWSENNS